MVYWKCLLSLTILSKLIALASIYTPVGWFHASSLTLLICVSILGNVLTIFFKSTVGKYCNVSALTADVGNFMGHVVVTLIIAIVLVWKHGKSSDIMSWKHAGFSTGLVLGVGVLYFVLMMLGLVCSYGLDLKTQIWFAVAWVILALFATPFSLFVFNKKSYK